MPSPFAQFCLEHGFSTLFEHSGEAITIIHPVTLPYDPSTGSAKTPDDGVTQTTTTAVGIVADETVKMGDTLRVTGMLTVQTKSPVVEGDTVVVRGKRNFVQSVEHPIEGLYQFKASR